MPWNTTTKGAGQCDAAQGAGKDHRPEKVKERIWRPSPSGR
ncbi:MAG: hypothetical protein ACLTYN_16030 [Dysosmobacter welbionis]